MSEKHPPCNDAVPVHIGEKELRDCVSLASLVPHSQARSKSESKPDPIDSYRDF